LSPEGGFALLRELAANACRDSQEIGAPSAAKLFRDAPANSRDAAGPPRSEGSALLFYLLLTKFLAARPIARIRRSHRLTLNKIRTKMEQ